MGMFGKHDVSGEPQRQASESNGYRQSDLPSRMVLILIRPNPFLAFAKCIAKQAAFDFQDFAD